MEGTEYGGKIWWRGERVAEQRGWQGERVQASLLSNLSPYTLSPVRLPFPPPSLPSALSPVRLLSPAPSSFYGLWHILLLHVRLCPSPLLPLVLHTSVSHSPLFYPCGAPMAPLSSSSFPFSPFRLCSHSPIAPSPPFRPFALFHCLLCSSAHEAPIPCMLLPFDVSLLSSGQPLILPCSPLTAAYVKTCHRWSIHLCSVPSVLQHEGLHIPLDLKRAVLRSCAQQSTQTSPEQEEESKRRREIC